MPRGQTRLAAPWIPDRTLAADFHEYDDPAPRACLAATWSALDCVGGWAGDLTERLMVLGRMTAIIDDLPVLGEQHVVTGERPRVTGRKTFTASTLHDADGRIVGRAEHAGWPWTRRRSTAELALQGAVVASHHRTNARRSSSFHPESRWLTSRSRIREIVSRRWVPSVVIARIAARRVALRFEPKFAIPVMIALFHDLLITAGVYSLTGREVTTSTVAAILTILGYSLYDVVIVFDRIRENAPRMPRAAFSQIVNRSMSDVLTRSLATSFSTLMGVTAILLFGGETLKDFAFALLVGIVSGTYSSIFIAAPC